MLLVAFSNLRLYIQASDMVFSPKLTAALLLISVVYWLPYKTQLKHKDKFKHYVVSTLMDVRGT